jgi:hypothetical protein
MRLVEPIPRLSALSASSTTSSSSSSAASNSGSGLRQLFIGVGSLLDGDFGCSSGGTKTAGGRRLLGSTIHVWRILVACLLKSVALNLATAFRLILLNQLDITNCVQVKAIRMANCIMAFALNSAKASRLVR